MRLALTFCPALLIFSGFLHAADPIRGRVRVTASCLDAYNRASAQLTGSSEEVARILSIAQGNGGKRDNVCAGLILHNIA